MSLADSIRKTASMARCVSEEVTGRSDQLPAAVKSRKAVPNGVPSQGRPESLCHASQAPPCGRADQVSPASEFSVSRQRDNFRGSRGHLGLTSYIGEGHTGEAEGRGIPIGEGRVMASQNR